MMTNADAAQHRAVKKNFCKVDCSQAYHCIQTADEQCEVLVFFNFDSRKFAHKSSAQILNKEVSVSTGVIMNYLDPVVKAD